MADRANRFAAAILHRPPPAAPPPRAGSANPPSSSRHLVTAVGDDEPSYEENTCENIPSYLMSEGPDDEEDEESPLKGIRTFQQHDQQPAQSLLNNKSDAKNNNLRRSASMMSSNQPSSSSEASHRHHQFRHKPLHGASSSQSSSNSHQPLLMTNSTNSQQTTINKPLPPFQHQQFANTSKAATIRQHYYPEGGWGWVVLACATASHALGAGLQLAYGEMLIVVRDKFATPAGRKSGVVAHALSSQGAGGEAAVEGAGLTFPSVSSSGPGIISIGLVGGMSLAVGLFLSPLIVGICRRKSTRLTAVLGGLVTALGCLFTSFATQFHQIFFSYGAVIGVGAGLTRDTATLMVGQYFKRRREFVEIFVVSGSGLGIALMSFFIHGAVGSLGWRFGLQAITAALTSTFFLGTFYRSATLYHPQRRAILHLKNQRKRIKDTKANKKLQQQQQSQRAKQLKNQQDGSRNINNNNHQQPQGAAGGLTDTRPPFLDFSALRSRTFQILLFATAVASFGLNTPLIFLASQTAELIDAETPIFLQVFLGMGWVLGACAFGLIVVQNSTDCRIARLYLCQASVIICGLSLVALAAVEGYQGYSLFVWIYGVFSGGYQYSLKMFTFEKVRARNFPRAWAIVQCSQAIPIVIGVPICGFINVSFGGKAGYYFSAACVLAGGASLFLINVRRRRRRRRAQKMASTTGTAAVTTTAAVAAAATAAAPASIAGCTCAASGATAAAEASNTLGSPNASQESHHQRLSSRISSALEKYSFKGAHGNKSQQQQLLQHETSPLMCSLHPTVSNASSTTAGAGVDGSIGSLLWGAKGAAGAAQGPHSELGAVGGPLLGDIVVNKFQNPALVRDADDSSSPDEDDDNWERLEAYQRLQARRALAILSKAAKASGGKLPRNLAGLAALATMLQGGPGGGGGAEGGLSTSSFSPSALVALERGRLRRVMSLRRERQVSPDPAPGIEDIPSDDEAIADAELDLPDDMFQDFDLDLDFEVDFGGDCITSCNLMDNYVLHSEYEANLNYSPGNNGADSRSRKRSLQRQASTTAAGGAGHHQQPGHHGGSSEEPEGQHHQGAPTSQHGRRRPPVTSWRVASLSRHPLPDFETVREESCEVP